MLLNRNVTQVGVHFINYIIITLLRVINTIKDKVLMQYLLLINYVISVKTMYDKMLYSK